MSSGTGPVDLAAITLAASREAGGVPPGLLGDYLPAVLDAARSGRRLTAAELAGYGRSGERAAESGVALRGLVDLFLSATWRLWRELPGDQDSPTVLRAAGLAVLRAADDAVAAAAEGFERAYLSVARRDEAERREFFDDLLSGRSSPGDVMDRGERLGLRLAGPHYVLLAGPGAPGDAVLPAGLEIDAAVADAAAPSPSLVLSRHGRLVVIVGAVGGGEADRVARALTRALSHRTGGGAAGRGQPVTSGGHPAAPDGQKAMPDGQPAAPDGQKAVPDGQKAAAAGRPLRWRIAFGRPYPGPSGVVHSYDEAADAFDVAERLGLPDPVASAADLLIYQVLLRDRAAITDLVRTVIVPLARARGGAGPLLATLAAYFAHGGVAAAAARDLHLSVRAVTYRLTRVKELTGRDPAQPADALALHVAVIGAQVLDWPATRLEPA
jgi:hypothetical protein